MAVSLSMLLVSSCGGAAVLEPGPLEPPPDDRTLAHVAPTGERPAVVAPEVVRADSAFVVTLTVWSGTCSEITGHRVDQQGRQTSIRVFVARRELQRPDDLPDDALYLCAGEGIVVRHDVEVELSEPGEHEIVVFAGPLVPSEEPEIVAMRHQIEVVE